VGAFCFEGSLVFLLLTIKTFSLGISMQENNQFDNIIGLFSEMGNVFSAIL
jgi:uncharacterized membrane protein